jgi:hypothetical protein
MPLNVLTGTLLLLCLFASFLALVWDRFAVAATWDAWDRAQDLEFGASLSIPRRACITEVILSFSFGRAYWQMSVAWS